MLICLFPAVASIATDGFAIDELGCDMSANRGYHGWFD
jgi:hypothetical protein